MAVKVIKFKVRHEGKIFTTEEGNNIIVGLSKEEEQRLIDEGFCEQFVTEEKNSEVKESKKLKKDKDSEEVI